MKLKVDKSEGYNWSIVVDKKELRRLDEIIKEAFKDGTELKLKYHIKCSDGSLIETDDINEVVSEENSKNRRIESITMGTENPKSSKSMYISFGEKELSERTVYYSISGDSRDWVYLTASKIEERIKNIKEWYSIIPKFDPMWIYTVIFFSALYYLQDLPKSIATKYPLISQDTTEIALLLAIFGFLYIIHQFLTKKVYPYLFPSVVFRIGDGIKRHDEAIKLRGQIFWGIIVSLVVSLIASLIIL